MKAKLHLVFCIAIFFLALNARSQQTYWKSEISNGKHLPSFIAADSKSKPSYFSLNEKVFETAIQSVSKEVYGKVYFPIAKGEYKAFTIIETPVFSPDLAKKYPQIRSFTGLSADRKIKIRFSTSQKGLQAMTIDLEDHSVAFIQKTDQEYIQYTGKSELNAKDAFTCHTLKAGLGQRIASKTLADDQTLRRYRIAVSTTGEYTNYHGGTVADALAAINATLTRVNEVFETDLAVTLELVANNDQVIFTDADTDPYNGNLNSQVQGTLTSIIGEANYDVGHLFQRDSNNGNAGFIGSVCIDNRKGSAFSSGVNPEGDLFDLDFVAHELGHQFGANHTWSFESEGTGVQAEPASGTTIMGYAGIVPGNDVEPNGDDYFHYYSIQQITDYLETVSCAATTDLTNAPPVIVPSNDFVIPISTAFVLEANAIDPNAADVLTYAWEQIDNGVVTTSSFGPQNASGANFRSLPPSTSPNRYFPKLSEVALGNLTQTQPERSSAWETVSSIQRELNFAVTVRDNAAGGGQVSTDLVKVQVVAGAGPFVVTSQTTNEAYEAGSIQAVTWDVANTNVAPVNAQTVDIFLSVDGGNSFSERIARGIPNSGTANVLLPQAATTQARFMVKASDNIFFAVNSSNFTIQETEVVLDFEALQFQVCQPADLDVPFTYETTGGFSETSTFSASAPAGLNVAFSPISASSDDTDVTITFSNTGGVAEGTYPITIIASSASVTKEVIINLEVYDATFDTIMMTGPANGQVNTTISPTFEWQQEQSASSYDIEIATDNTFMNIIESATVVSTKYESNSLQPETGYFWRVRPKNDCGVGGFGQPFSFTTTPVNCKSYGASGLPLEISAQGTPVVTAMISIFDDLPIADVDLNLELTHAFLGDLIITLTSPSGTEVVLLSNNCNNLDDIDAQFDDAGSPLACGGIPAVSGMVQPLGGLASLNGESLSGDWVLTVRDIVPSDGGSLVNFSLDICAEGIFRPDDDEDGVFDDGDDLCLGTPKGVLVDTNGCPLNDFAQDNFQIQVDSETCRTNNDGRVSIDAVDTSIDYSATLTGNGIVETATFDDIQVFENLTAGQYTLCVTGTNGVINYRERCFDIVIAQPELLTAATTLLADQKQLQVRLSGGILYNVELNGLVTQTTESEVTLDLKKGQNLLKIRTNLPCQGVYEESLFIADGPILYPNPVNNVADIYFLDDAESATVWVYALNGQLVRKEEQPLNGNNISLNFGELPPGVYYINVSSKTKRQSLKMIKQ